MIALYIQGLLQSKIVLDAAIVRLAAAQINITTSLSPQERVISECDVLREQENVDFFAKSFSRDCDYMLQLMGYAAFGRHEAKHKYLAQTEYGNYIVFSDNILHASSVLRANCLSVEHIEKIS